MSGTAHRLALIGLGEVGQTLAADLLRGDALGSARSDARSDASSDSRGGALHVAIWDRLLPTPGSVPAQGLAKLTGLLSAAGPQGATDLRDTAGPNGATGPRDATSQGGTTTLRSAGARDTTLPSDIINLRGATSLRDALAEATLVISAVTAGECVAVAREAAASLRAGAFYFDLNSVSPAAREEAARHIEFAGGRFVESAIMSPIAPKRIASPMLLGGPHAREFLPVARALGFSGAQVFAESIGRASAAKMCRSIVVKGMEALLSESLLAARHHGVEREVLDSLSDLFPGVDWRKTARYMVSRSLLHGRRRAEEMREAAQTAREAGLTPWMSHACVERQAWAARRADALRQEGLEDMLDALLERTETA